MRYVLIPVSDKGASVGDVLQGVESDHLSDVDRDGLARILERTVLTCELLVDYAVAVAGKPLRH